MSYLLREVLLGALGIESDLQWGTSGTDLSAIDLELLPPSAGALIQRITDLGKVYRFLEETTQEQQANPYCQALYDSIENYLDQYRSTILQADSEINSGLLTTLTGLVAYVEPFQHELQFIGRILSPLIAASPLEMLNKIHEYVVVSPPSISMKLVSFERALQQVAMSQLTGFLFYHQQLPDIFEKHDRIVYAKSLNVTFVPHQLAELLLLIVNVAAHCEDLFDDIDPPDYDQLMPWIAFMAKTSSTILSKRISELWPNYFYTLKSIILLQRYDFIQILSRKMLQPFVSSYDMNLVFHKLSPEYKANLDLMPTGLSIRSKLKPPLDLVVTDDHQALLGEMFKLFMKLAVAEEAIGDIWQNVKRKKLKLFRFAGFIHQLLSAIKEHIVFVVITPALLNLEKAGAEMTDFLKFKGEFAAFVLTLSVAFPAGNPEFQNAINSLGDRTVEMRELLITKNLLGKASEAQIFDAVSEAEKEIITGVSVIASVLKGGEDNGINLSERLMKLVACVKACSK